jgi:hypothetical protein
MHYFLVGLSNLFSQTNGIWAPLTDFYHNYEAFVENFINYSQFQGHNHFNALIEKDSLRVAYNKHVSSMKRKTTVIM